MTVFGTRARSRRRSNEMLAWMTTRLDTTERGRGEGGLAPFNE